MKSDINRRLNERKKQLEWLGPCREHREQQCQYLLKLATRFQNTTFLALTARYGADDIFDATPGLKLATAVVDRNAVFADRVWKIGHTMTFRQGSKVSEHENEYDEVSICAAEVDDSGGRYYSVCHRAAEPELEGILHDDCSVPIPKAGIMLWLEKEYKSSRGFELGTFDASLLPNIWKKQSANWDDLALGYVSDIVSLVHGFTVTLMSAICEDDRVRAALMSILMDGFIERYKMGIDHAKFVLSVERTGTPLTANHYFADNLEK